MVLLRKRTACTQHPCLDAIALQQSHCIAAARLHPATAPSSSPPRCLLQPSVLPTASSPVQAPAPAPAPAEPSRMRRLARRDCPKHDAHTHIHAHALGRMHRRRDAE